MNEQQQQELTAGLRALAERTRDASASPRVEEAVIASMNHARVRPIPPRLATPRPSSTLAPDRQRWYRFLPIAAALIFAVSGALWMVRPGVQGGRVEVVPLTGFVAVPMAAALPELESASVIRVTLPVSVLPAYGVAIVPEMPGQTVQADLLVAQDGHPRAIRLVDVSTTTGSTP